MIWYRHWLELRARLPAVAATAVVLGAWQLTFIDRENAVFFQALRSLPAADGEALALAISRTIFVAWVGAIAVCGNGLRTWYMDRMAPSDMDLPFTLTLPAARARLVRTRLAAGWLVAVLVAVLAMGSQAASLALRGHGVPLAPMAGAVALLAVGMMANVVVLGWALMARGAWLLPSLTAAILVCFPLLVALVMGGLNGNATTVALSLAGLAGLAAAAYGFTMRRVGRLEC